MSDASPWQRRLRAQVGLPPDRHHWPITLRQLPADLEASPLTVPFSLPLLARAQQRFQQRGRRVVIGLNGPVGAGKSTLARQLNQLASRFGLRLAVASIDDAYRPLPERRRLLEGNPFGVSRVPPGTHDIPLMLEAIERWQQGGVLRLPRFNKTLEGGEGERDGWVEFDADVLVLEGWLIGCRPLDDQTLRRALNGPGIAGTATSAGAVALNATPKGPGHDTTGTASEGERNVRVLPSGGGPAASGAWLTLSDCEKLWIPRWNTNLQPYEALWDRLDSLWLLRPLDWTLSRRWRLQAEARQRRAGGGWLNARDLDALVRSSLASLPPGLYQEPLVESNRPGMASAAAEAVAEAVALIDGQRRCRWSGLTTDWPPSPEAR